MQLPPQALWSHDRAGKKKGPLPPPSVVLFSPPFPWGAETLKANTPAHPEAPADVTPPDPCTFIKEGLFFFGIVGREREIVSLHAALSSFPHFFFFHSRALTEAVYRGGRLESAADVREGQGTSPRYMLVLAGPDRPQGGRAVPSEQALAVQLLTLKWSPAKGYAKDTQHHDTGLGVETINSSLLHPAPPRNNRCTRSTTSPEDRLTFHLEVFRRDLERFTSSVLINDYIMTGKRKF